MNKIQTPSSQDKWIATGIWVVILVLLILATNGIFPSINYLASFFPLFTTAYINIPAWTAISFVLTVLAFFYFILRAWGRFFTFSRQLFVSLGKTIEGSETGSVFYSFLSFGKEKGNDRSTEIQPLAENATGSIISSIIWLIALSYLMVFVELAIIVFSTIFITT